MPHLSRIERVRGSMLGLAVGDALGAPLEGLSAQQIRAHYGQVVDYVDGARAWKRKPYRWRMPGLYSDDTQQALALCDVLLESGRVEPERLAELYLGLANPKGTYVGAHRGVGRSFRQVLADLERGVSPRHTGQTSAGIGAAMRIAAGAALLQRRARGDVRGGDGGEPDDASRHPQPGRGDGRRPRRPPACGRRPPRPQLPVPPGG